MEPPRALFKPRSNGIFTQVFDLVVLTLGCYRLESILVVKDGFRKRAGRAVGTVMLTCEPCLGLRTGFANLQAVLSTEEGVDCLFSRWQVSRTSMRCHDELNLDSLRVKGEVRELCNFGECRAA